MSKSFFEVHENYTYSEIEAVANKENMEVQRFGKIQIGQGFLLAYHRNVRLAYSFILIRALDSDLLYSCVSETVQDSITL